MKTEIIVAPTLETKSTKSKKQLNVKRIIRSVLLIAIVGIFVTIKQPIIAVFILLSAMLAGEVREIYKVIRAGISAAKYGQTEDDIQDELWR